jgi:indolepyruvate ferredoxin oxidoreductase beta subunit
MKHRLSNAKVHSKVYRGGKEEATQPYRILRRGADDDANKSRRWKAALAKDPMNVIITGVGGQGNVLASRVLAGMLVNEGFRITIGETFGMSQRGGSVMSHLRISQKQIWSPQIPQGRADIIVALEPLEALRVAVKYGNPDVVVLANSRVVYPIGVITGESNYPSESEMQDFLKRIAARSWLFDATAEAVRLGNPVLSNIIMIGALAAADLLPIDRRSFEKEIMKNMPQAKQKINLAAFDTGGKLI